MPKDIVSGDFYWISKIKETLVVTVADCTGHGVPGAFMSMLGISFLNEIVRKKEIAQANNILVELRKEIINALQQKGVLGEQKDGMDMSLLALNTHTLAASWAGANNPLWIIRNPNTKTLNSKPQILNQKQESDNSSEFRDLDLEISACNLEFRNLDLVLVEVPALSLVEVKGDKMPIAIYDRMEDFTSHEIELQQGDSIYLMSDGYEDQFGGPKGKKFLSKNLKQLIIDNSHRPMIEQKTILDNTIMEWIGSGEQIDDITVVGFKV
jgi:serine phosphatase RsbU (regulator of sigma subunit)